jgi:hypothetical protein
LVFGLFLGGGSASAAGSGIGVGSSRGGSDSGSAVGSASRVSGCFGFRLATAGVLVFAFFLVGRSVSTSGSGRGIGSSCRGSDCDSTGAFLCDLGTRTRFRTFRLAGFLSVEGSWCDLSVAASVIAGSRVCSVCSCLVAFLFRFWNQAWSSSSSLTSLFLLGAGACTEDGDAGICWGSV